MLNELLTLPYSWETRLLNDGSGYYYFSKCRELPGCMTDAKSLEELKSNQLEALTLCLEVLMEKGEEIPLPVLVLTAIDRRKESQGHLCHGVEEIYGKND